MGVLGTTRPGDLTKCLWLNDRAACERVFFGFYLWPRLQKLLEELELVREIQIIPIPRPDPPTRFSRSSLRRSSGRCSSAIRIPSQIGKPVAR
jgi:hypothetical protein